MLLRTGIASLLATAASALSCTRTAYLGCYNDSVAHPVSFLVDLADTTMDLDSCMLLCAANGFTIMAATAHDTPTPAEGYCYCGLSLDPTSQKVPDASCDVACPGNSTQACGGSGYTSTYTVTCNSTLPPAPVGPALPAGPACSQPESVQFAFCNTSLPLEARVTDLITRLSLEEAGQQLTARQSPAIPRLGIPAFYWGSNALHGLQNGAECLTATDGTTRCPTSWPHVIALASTWNDTVWNVMGATTGIEMRAFSNTAWPQAGLTAWGPTQASKMTAV
jgi:hypothetical protein